MLHTVTVTGSCASARAASFLSICCMRGGEGREIFLVYVGHNKFSSLSLHLLRSFFFAESNDIAC